MKIERKFHIAAPNAWFGCSRMRVVHHQCESCNGDARVRLKTKTKTTTITRFVLNY